MLSRTITTLTIFALLGTATGAQAANNCTANDRPNIVLFMADDQGWADLPIFANTRPEGHYLRSQLPCTDPMNPECKRCTDPTNPNCTLPVCANPVCSASLLAADNQCPQCLTPNLDALAAQGVRFDHFYAAAPLCAPARASILTGRYGRRTGVTANESLRTLPPKEVTFAEHLRSGCQTTGTSSGVCYTTGMMGKWHNGWNAKAPWKQGFEEFVGFERSQSSIYLRKWRCFPAQLGHLLHAPDPSEPEENRFGPGLLRLDPTRSDDLCRSIGSKDNDGEMTVPEYAPCEGAAGQATCGGGSLRCGGPEDCPFYGCLGHCTSDPNVRCMTDANCPDNGSCQGYDLCTGSTDVAPCQPGDTCDATQPHVPTIVSEDARHSTWILRDLAISFIRRHKAESCPFLLVVPLRSPHAPTKAPFDESRFSYLPKKGQERGLWAGIQDNDTLVGAIMKEVDTIPTTGRTTLVLFTSDNGKRHHNEVLTGSKFQVEEGGIRVGLIARWTGRILAPKVIDHRVGQHNDLFPTIAEAAGAPLQASFGSPNDAPRCFSTFQDSTMVPVDGRSLLPILLDDPGSIEEHDFMFFDFEGQAVRSRRAFYEGAVDPSGSPYAGRTFADGCTPCSPGDCHDDGSGILDCSCEPAAWKLVKSGGAARLYNLTYDAKEETDCRKRPVPENPHPSVVAVAEDMCRRAAYWEAFTKTAPNVPERCVENVPQDTIAEWWGDTSCLD